MERLLTMFFVIALFFIFGCSENTPTEIVENNKIYYEGGPNIDSDGSYYTTVKIGDQIWLKENLNIGTFIQSTSMSYHQVNNDTIEKFCYDNDETYCEMFGGLYQWNEAMQYDTTEGTQGICPDGWHIPTLEEFRILNDKVGGNSNTLKAIGQGTNSAAGTDSTGFSALLGGYRNTNGDFYYLTRDTYIWNSSMTNPVNTSNMGILFNSDEIYFDNYSVYCGLSIRCLKN